MRLIGTIENERDALIFSGFLQQKGVQHQIEIQTDKDWGSPSYGSHQCRVWIYEEDQVEEVNKWFHLFKENPRNPIFYPQPTELTPEGPFSTAPPLPPAPTSWEKEPMGWMTRTLVAVCCALLLLSYFFNPFTQIPERYSGLILFTSPIERTLLFDYPKFYQLIERFLRVYGYEELEHPKDLSIEGQHLLQQINQTPYWPGFYHLLIKKGWQGLKKGFTQYPTFEKIRQGQLWRLFTPCLLHANLFHLFFNMIWLIVLGKQMEQRLRPLRYAIFILIVGVVSNIAQYLMSGPNFIGFSGILTGMLAFIWVRQKVAAWEGYQIDRLTLVFMLIFIIGMALIQLISFILEKSMNLAFSPNIANMAHLTGGVMGFLLAKLNFFSWRHA
jgi:GlpG protein